MLRGAPLSLSLLLVTGLALGHDAAAQGCLTVTELASQAGGTSGNSASTVAALSADGRYVAFVSHASDLVAGDTNNTRDVFRLDRATGTVELVSTSSAGVQGDDRSYLPSISDDGRLIAFESDATNLVPGDTNGLGDVFVKDMQTGACELVSVAAFGAPANGFSWVPEISGDGRYVAFQTLATNLLLVPDTNGATDVYVRDRLGGLTALVSVASGGGFANGSSYVSSISIDGRYVAFRSTATDVVGLDTNAEQDVFLRDRVLGQTSRVSVGPQLLPGLWVQANGASNGGSVSDDGSLVVFGSFASNLVSGDTNGTTDVFVRNRLTGTTTMITKAALTGTAANGSSNPGKITGDGSAVVFDSLASNLVTNDSNGERDVFRHELATGSTTLVSLATNGQQAFDDSVNPTIARDGGWVAWESAWAFGFPGDGNAVSDVFVRGQDCTFPEIHCTAKVTSNGCTPRIFWLGEAKADLSGGFVILASEVLNQKPGVMFYGLSGRAALPFQNGFLCVQPPTKRGPITFSFGNPPPDDCSGRFTLDMDAYASGALGGNPLPQLTIPGTVVNAQWWGRDPGFAAPNDTILSNAIEYTVRP